MVLAEERGEGGVAEKPCEEVVVTIFEDLAADGGVLAALDEDERRVPALQVFDHESVLEAV